MQTLLTPTAMSVLKREHRAAKAQRMERKAHREAGIARPRDTDFRTSDMLRTNYLAIGPAQGRWLCGLAIAQNAQEIVEFGSSFGISTMYLAAAAAQTGGRVTGSEFHPEKAAKARQNLEEAGLEATILTGDAMETLAGTGPQIDLLFLDGAKDLYLPVLRMLQPRLHIGSVVVADNIPLEKEDRATGGTADFNAYVADPANGFLTSVPGFAKGGMSFSVFHGTPSA